jgi:5-formyltetrahydrofolate cyclo-ligase
MAAELAIGKQALRSSIKKILKTLSNEYIVKCSQQCALRVRELPAFHRGGVVCTYVSMPTEIQTDGLIGASFDLKKRVCIPKVLGKESSDMIMIELPSVADLLALPKNSWGIPEHSLQMIRDNDIVDFTQSGLIDFIVIPGVAFDEKGNRLGHGRGYYGEWA